MFRPEVNARLIVSIVRVSVDCNESIISLQVKIKWIRFVCPCLANDESNDDYDDHGVDGALK